MEAPSKDALCISPRLLAHVKSSEGLRLRAYQDVAGVWTIGYGQTKGVKDGDFWSPEEAELDLKATLLQTMFEVKQNVLVPLYSGQIEALTDFVYNLGLGQFLNSTMFKLLQRKDFTAAALEFPKWVLANKRPQEGLKIRRAVEQRWFTEHEG